MKEEPNIMSKTSVTMGKTIQAFGLILSLLGALAGCLFASFLAAASFTTTNWSSFTEVKFRFHFSPGIALKATFFAVVMGLLGGLLPAARAARLQIAEATKG